MQAQEDYWRANLLIVDDDSNALNALRTGLRKHRTEWNLSFHGDASDLLFRLRELEHAVIVSDRNMPGTDGYQLCMEARRLVTDPSCRLSALYFIVLSGARDPDSVADALDLGADDFIAKPCTKSDLLARIRVGVRSCRAIYKYVQLERRTRDSEPIDSATSLPNQRGAEARITAEMAQVQRGLRCLTLVCVEFNEPEEESESFHPSTHMPALANCLRARIRRYDVAVRWNEHEIILLLIGCDSGPARAILERVQKYARSQEADPTTDSIPEFSAGMASTSDFPELNFDQLLSFARDAVQVAKTKGPGRCQDAAETTPGIPEQVSA